MTRSSSAPADRPRRLRRWLRGSCLSHLPLLGRFFRSCKPQPAPRPVRRSTALGGEFLEDRNVPDYVYALAQTALLGEAALYVAASLRTPEQVLLHGWGDSHDDTAGPPAQRPAEPVRPALADAVFLNLTVTPSPQERTPPPEQEQTAATQPTPATESAQDEGHEPLAFESADEALAPVFDQDFLDQAKRLLAVPLPSDDAGSAGSVASPEEARPETTGLGDEGSFGGPSGGGLADPAPAASGGTGGVSSDDGFNPFLSANAAAPRNAGPLAVATPDALALPAVLPLSPAPAVPFDTPTLPAPGTPTPTPTPPFGGQAETLAPLPGVVPAPPVLMPGFALPMTFSPNEGQGPDGSAYLSQGAGYAIALAPQGITLALSPTASNSTTPAPPELIHLHFAGATPDAASLHPKDEQVGRLNFFRGGAQPLSLTDVPTFASVSQDLAPGLSVVYHGNGPNLQFDFELAPGMDPATVAMSYEGVRGATVDAQGQLVLHTPGGRDLVVAAPTLYQTAADGTRQLVAGGYSVHADGTVGFHVGGAYDPSRGLVLDPTVLLSSYLGGSGADNGNAITTDAAGAIYLVGGTTSSDFPTTYAYDSTYGSPGDAFVSKLSPSGTLLFSTYLGGVMVQGDQGLAVAVDPGGDVYLTGQAGSLAFPTTSGAYQATLSGTYDAFVTKFSASGDALVFSTLLGGSGTETGRGIGVASDGSVYVAGQTDSTNFPTASAAQGSNGGSQDGFLTKLKSDGSGLVFSTYAGGAFTEDLRGLAVDAQDRVVVVGTTASSGLGTSGAYKTSLSGTQDLLVRRYTAAGALDWSTYVGGSSTEGGDAVALDSSGQVYVAGWTQSTGIATTGAYQTGLSGTQDALVARLAAAGSALGWLSYLGGGSSEEATGIAVDGSQNVYVAGLTNSSAGFPTPNGVQTLYGGGAHDAFVSAFAAGGATLPWSTYLGGSGDDTAAGLALDLDNNFYLVGSTASTDFPVQSGSQSSNGGGTSDVFLSKLSPLPPPVFTGISNDSGSSSTDGITTNQHQMLSGTSLANATITLYRAGVGELGTTTSSAQGTWTYDYSGTTLPAGIATFWATADLGANPSVPTPPFFTNIDLTAPQAFLYLVATTIYDTAVQAWVWIRDANLAATTTVTVQKDGDNDGDFTDPGESNWYSFPIDIVYETTGVWLTFPPVPMGPSGIRLMVTDLAGNVGYSNIVNINVVSSGSGYTTTDGTPSSTPITGGLPGDHAPPASVPPVPIPIPSPPVPGTPGPGIPGSLSLPPWVPGPWPPAPSPDIGDLGPLLQRDDLQVLHELDLDQSPDTDVGGSPALSYNSERVNVKPIIQAEIQSDNSVALPSTITATLTFGGTTQTGQTYSTSGLATGTLLVVAQQVSSPVTTSGRYTYTLQVSFNYGTPVLCTLTGAAFVIAEDSSPYGAGWTMTGVDRLISVPRQTAGTYTFAAGMLREYGDEGYAFYAEDGAGGYTSPAGDNGTLTKQDNGRITYTYTSPDGSTQVFDDKGLLFKATSSDGFAAITYTYASYNLTGIATPDGALTTLAYSLSKVSTIQTGTRTVTLTNGTGDLTIIANPDGGLRTFAYDGTHHLTDDRFDVLRGTFVYTHGVPTGFTTGDTSTDSSAGSSTIDPGILKGLDSLAAGPVWTVLTDPLGHTTRARMDSADRLAVLIAPDGGVTSLTRDSNGWITKEIDPLSRVTTIARDSAGYITQQTTPDGNSLNYTYQTAFHALTGFTDQSGNRSTFTYDAGNGHLLTAKDALNEVTTYTYNTSSGLLETVTDALGHVSTLLYDSARRLQTTIDALGDRATATYDSNGNPATQVDELGRTTTFVNDVFGRVTQQTDPTGALATYVYNKVGLETSSKDALGHSTSITYNSRGEQTKVMDGVGTSVQRSYSSSYNIAGQDTVDRDAKGNVLTTTYDAAGRTKNQISPYGTVTYDYNFDGETTQQLDELGRPTNYGYDSMGRVQTTTDALSNVTTTLYDAAGNVSEVDDARGYKTTYAYDKLNRQVAMTQAAGTADAATSTTVYDAVGNVYQTIDPLGHITQNGYDKLNRVTTVTQALGTSDQRVLTYAYDKVGNQVSATDARGIRTDTTFDKANRVTVVTQAAGTSLAAATTTVYDAQGNVSSVTDPLGRTTTYAYDPLNRQVSQTTASGTADAETTSVKMDLNGNVYSELDGLQHGNKTSYDQLGRAIQFTDRLGDTTRQWYDAAGSLWQTADARTNPTYYTRYYTDQLGRQQTVRDALKGYSTTVYDAVGNTIATVDANHNRTTMVYDGLGRVIAQTDALNHTVSTVYDKAGNVLRTIDAAGKTTTYTYDNLNRQITVQAPGAGVVTAVYDAGDHVVNTIDPLGNKATMVYDALGRKTQDIDALGKTTTYLYDLVGNRTGLIDPDGNRTTFVYDNQNRVVQQTDPLGHSLTMAYDADNRLTSKTDRLGRRIDYEYDWNGQLTTETWRDSGGSVVNTLSHQYDNNGNETLGQDSHGAYTMTYDGLNRVSTVQGLFGLSLTNTYDAVGNRTKLEDSKGGVTTSVYNAVNLLTSRQFGGASQTPLRFDTAYTSRNLVGTITRYSDLAGTSKVGESDYSYDDGQRVTNIQHKNGSGTVLSQLTYTYDNAGRLSTDQIDGTVRTYSYDADSQLTNDGTATFTFDAAGNRTMTGYTTGTDNRLTNDGVWTYTYDNEGNLTKRSKGALAETWNFGYDNQNQMTSAEQHATDGGTLQLKLVEQYDVYGRRIEEDRWASATGTVVLHFGYDGENVLLDLDGSNNVSARYVRPDGIDALGARVVGTVVAWYDTDREGSVVSLTDGSGVNQGTITYSGFGTITNNTTGTFGDRWTYAGREFQGDVQLYYNRARWYNPATGRWTTEDTIGFSAGDYNVNRYVHNNPTNVTDPSGLQERSLSVDITNVSIRTMLDHLERLEGKDARKIYLDEMGDQFKVDFTKKENLDLQSVIRAWKVKLGDDTTFRFAYAVPVLFAGQKEKGSIIQIVKRTDKSYDKKGKERMLPTESTKIEGWSITPPKGKKSPYKGYAYGPDVHRSLIILEDDKESKITREIVMTVGYGTYDNKEVDPAKGFQAFSDDPRDTGNIQWIGKKKEYKIYIELRDDGKWIFEAYGLGRRTGTLDKEDKPK